MTICSAGKSCEILRMPIQIREIFERMCMRVLQLTWCGTWCGGESRNSVLVVHPFLRRPTCYIEFHYVATNVT